MGRQRDDRQDRCTALPGLPGLRGPFTPTGRQRYCTTACRKTAFRRRHATLEPIVVPPPATRRDRTIYQCNACGTRQLSQQRCPDCGTFGSSLGLGGTCPSCDEPVTLTDLDLTT